MLTKKDKKKKKKKTEKYDWVYPQARKLSPRTGEGHGTEAVLQFNIRLRNVYRTVESAFVNSGSYTV